MFHARRLCVAFIVVFLSSQANEAICQMKYSISEEMYAKCAESIAGYVEKTRGWGKGTYEISFGGIYERHAAAAFGITSNAVIEDLERKKHAPEGRILRHHPDDFVVLVDIVDFAVLSENTLDTYFPNAQPGYHRYPFQGKIEKQE